MVLYGRATSARTIDLRRQVTVQEGLMTGVLCLPHRRTVLCWLRTIGVVPLRLLEVTRLLSDLLHLLLYHLFCLLNDQCGQAMNVVLQFLL